MAENPAACLTGVDQKMIENFPTQERLKMRLSIRSSPLDGSRLKKVWAVVVQDRNNHLTCPAQAIDIKPGR